MTLEGEPSECWKHRCGYSWCTRRRGPPKNERDSLQIRHRHVTRWLCCYFGSIGYLEFARRLIHFHFIFRPPCARQLDWVCCILHSPSSPRISGDNMLPSRPNAGGLPSGPRSRSVGRPPRQPEDVNRHDQTQSRSDAPPRQMRSQRSMASFPSAPTRSRSRPPPMPEPRQSNVRAPHSRRHDASVYETRSDAGGSHRSSGDSAASSGSSLFDRIKGGGGYASSRTSLGDDEDDPSKASVDNRGRSLRSRRLAQSEPPSPQGEKRFNISLLPSDLTHSPQTVNLKRTNLRLILELEMAIQSGAASPRLQAGSL